MSECNSVSTPVEKGTITTDRSEFIPAIVLYREAIVSLMFLAIVSRPNISYAVGVLSQVSDKPQQYFFDSDYAGDPFSRRSTSEMISMSYGGAASWRSQRQSCIALSTTEAEFIAASEAAKEAIWLGNLLSKLRSVPTIPVLQMGNQSVIRVVKNQSSIAELNI
ncbi:hypothetical protein AVEN_9641-1 [Araneus ventricosus]|uniref:Retrovirus-related Pol polyprotein from transposon TNT 1-94 n=1 Tax=Araneus ventricosus TaxID=182803 RepID=A0A4Y2EV46_ARAVE|nr:hypothetical protein AVEN_9641-1 [Araneus ventricosus]